jgi:hypothetical protein
MYLAVLTVCRIMGGFPGSTLAASRQPFLFRRIPALRLHSIVQTYSRCYEFGIVKVVPQRVIQRTAPFFRHFLCHNEAANGLRAVGYREWQTVRLTSTLSCGKLLTAWVPVRLGTFEPGIGNLQQIWISTISASKGSN